MRRVVMLGGLLVLVFSGSVSAADQSDVQLLLNKEVIGPRQTLLDLQAYLDPKIPRMPKPTAAAEWQQAAEQIRRDMLDRVVFRGAAARWRDARGRVEWLGTLAGGPGYRIKKLRYEAVPGLWIPALLYEPENMAGKVPVSLAVNGHDGIGKAAVYKQVRCINQAKRGMLVLNPEWLGMGQLRDPNYSHTRMNQLDLCGTSGLAPFYLAMARGLDVLLELPNADPARVAVSGLSGGGWQTIYISALDPRVTLANPVAGYSSFRTRLYHFKDLGDSEQTPCDMATVADYTHLTALRAPRPTLLTYNAKDDCCFESGYALPPLLDATEPIYRLFGRDRALQSHVNHDPGTHNFEKDNREAFYRMLGEFFFAGDPKFDAKEIDFAAEVKTRDDLAVELPKDNASFHSLALALSKELPRDAALPADRAAVRAWQQAKRATLRQLLAAKDYPVKAERTFEEEKGGVRAAGWKLRVGDGWTVPAVELSVGEPKGTTVLVADAGRRGAAAVARQLLDAGQRVVAVDPFYFGESKVEGRDWLFALLVAAVGDRPLGYQAGQVAAVARWLAAERNLGPVAVTAVGPRASLFALAAAGLEEQALAGLELHGSLGSLKEVIEQNRTVQEMPELFCFGLLGAFDVKQLTALVAPRPLTLVAPGDRLRAETAEVKRLYGSLGQEGQLRYREESR